MTDKLLVILVDLDANCGHYEHLKHRIDFEFDSIAAAMRGDEVVSQHGGLSFVALVEYGPIRMVNQIEARLPVNQCQLIDQ
jgi:hypothetical protein